MTFIFNRSGISPDLHLRFSQKLSQNLRQNLQSILTLMLGIMICLTLFSGRADAAKLSTGPVEVDCASIEGKRPMVALVFGQSNAANFGLSKKLSGHSVYSYHNGKCYKAADPLPGANGMGGSIWTRLGDIVISSKLYDSVLFVSVGYGGTIVADWKPGGKVHKRLVNGMRGPHAIGLEFTHLIWMQGESDAAGETTQKKYVSDFEEMLGSLRSGGVKAPVLVSLTSVCGVYESKAVRNAQRQLANEHAGVYQGPDTDALGRSHRYDDCHFNDKGLLKAAEAWFEAIKRIEK
jgi:hypothetical protein